MGVEGVCVPVLLYCSHELGAADDTRREAADTYLNNKTLSIGEVAYLLGYSEPAAFHRAFKRWQGITPQVFRQQYR
jgi:AraC-like DNA-binding protein